MEMIRRSNGVSLT